MKFFEKHPYLLITLAIILACFVFHVPFGWSVLIMLGYGLILYVTHLGHGCGLDRLYAGRPSEAPSVCS